MAQRMPGRKSIILRLSGREDGSVLQLFKRAVWSLSWEATPTELRQFIEGAPLDEWDKLITYCKEWMVIL